MVAETFIPHKESAILEVNHKDANKSNNHVDNLEWVTSAENKQHAKDNNLNGSKPVYVFDDNLELVCTYRSIMDVYRTTGWNTASISAACNMNPKTKSFGYYWSFEEKPNFKKISGNNRHI